MKLIYIKFKINSIKIKMTLFKIEPWVPQPSIRVRFVECFSFQQLLFKQMFYFLLVPLYFYLIGFWKTNKSHVVIASDKAEQDTWHTGTSLYGTENCFDWKIGPVNGRYCVSLRYGQRLRCICKYGTEIVKCRSVFMFMT